MKFTAEVVGDEHTEHLLERVGHRASDARPVLGDIADAFQRGQARNFSSAGAYFGDPWPGLADATKERYGAHRPLYLTGALERAVAGRGKGKLRRVSKTRVVVGVGLFYGIFQQAKRPIVGIARRDRKHALSMIQRYLLGR